MPTLPETGIDYDIRSCTGARDVRCSVRMFLPSTKVLAVVRQMNAHEQAIRSATHRGMTGTAAVAACRDRTRVCYVRCKCGVDDAPARARVSYTALKCFYRKTNEKNEKRKKPGKQPCGHNKPYVKQYILRWMTSGGLYNTAMSAIVRIAREKRSLAENPLVRLRRCDSSVCTTYGHAAAVTRPRQTDGRTCARAHQNLILLRRSHHDAMRRDRG